MKTKEQELKEELNRIKGLVQNLEGKIEVLELEKEDKFKIGDVCKFWNDNENEFVISKLTRLYDNGDGFYTLGTIYYKNAKKLNKQEAIELLFGSED